MDAPHPRPRRDPFPLPVLRRLLPVAERDEVLADLADEHRERRARDGRLRARLWLVRQVAGSLPALLARTVWRGRTGFEPPSSRYRPGGSMVEGWIVDLRYAARHLRRRPLVAVLAVSTLALGAGGATAITGIVTSYLLAPLPFPAEEELVSFWSPYDWSEAEHSMLRPDHPGFSAVAIHRDESLTLRGVVGSGGAGNGERASGPEGRAGVGQAAETVPGSTRLLDGVAASSELFRVLDRGALFGRTFEAADDRTGAAPVAVLAERLWRQLGADRAILGRTLALDGREVTVVGVMPADFWFPRPGVDLWIAQPLDPEDFSGNYAVVGRLEPGRSPETMDGPLAEMGAVLGERIPYPPEWDKTRDPFLTPLRQELLGEARPTLLATQAALVAILLLAAANVAALLLGHLGGRREELAIRSALGAPRSRLARQLVAEAALLGLGAGIGAAAVAAATFTLLQRTLPLGAVGETVALDWRVLAGSVALGQLVALATSLVPVVDLLRSDLGRGLRGRALPSVRGAVGSRGGRLEGALVVGEIALALLLAVGTILLLASVRNLGAIDPGLDPGGVAVVEVVLPEDRPRAERIELLHGLRRELAALPGVASAAAIQHLPLQQGSFSTDLEIEGRELPERVTTYFRMVTPRYFETVGLGLLRGRTFTDTDAAPPHDGLRNLGGAGDGPPPADPVAVSPSATPAEPPVVVNEALVRRFFGAEDPIGRRISVGFGRGWARIVGVVEDEAVAALVEAPAPTRYLLYEHVPFTPDRNGVVLAARDGLDPAVLARDAARAVTAALPEAAVARTTTLEAMRWRSMGATPRLLGLLGLLAGLAVGLGAVGVYGVVAHFVGRRSREWSLRLALGQGPGGVVAHVLGRSAALVGAGLVLGLVGSVSLGRVLQSLLYGVEPGDPIVLALAAGLLLLVGLLAALLPAWRAGRSDPATLLRAG